MHGGIITSTFANSCHMRSRISREIDRQTLLQVVYLVCTLGLGSFVSLGLRFGASRQSFSERALGVQLVKEFQTLTAEP